MKRTPTNLQLWLPLGLLLFLGGMLTFGLVSGQLTGQQQEEQMEAVSAAFQRGREQGYSQGVLDSPQLEVEQADINIVSAQTYFSTLQIELKSISRNTNAIDFVYGEPGRARHREPALDVGGTIALRTENRWYLIHHKSVSANLQRATVEVTRITLPIQ